MLSSGMDLQSAVNADPAGAEVGRLVGLGPAFRVLGAAGSAIAGSAPVQWLGRQLARPAVQAGVTAPLAVGGAAAATASDTQAPAPTPQLGPRTTEAQTALEAARKSLKELEDERKRLQGLAQRFDPDQFDWTSGTAAERKERIKAAQTAIGTNPDGTSGPDTRAALAAYRRRQLAAIDALGPRESTIRADITKAEERRAEAEKLDLQDAGSRRLQEAQPGWLEQSAPWLGLPLGFASGYALRRGLGSLSQRRAATQTADANALAAQFGQGDVPARVGRLNRFWTEGSPRTGAPPFGFAPGGTPYPWTSQTHQVRPGIMGGNVQREVLTPDQLYRQSIGARFAPTATTQALGGVEAGIGHLGSSYFGPQLAEAEAAANQEPTEANIQRLQRLRAAVAAFGFSERLGLGTMSGGLYGAAKHPMGRGGARPDVAAAEAERGALDMLLHPRATAPPVAPTPPAPAPAPAPLALPHTFQPRARGRFSGPPVYPPGDPRRK
jgi:hypothetical protein